MIASVIDGDALLQVIWGSAAAGIFVTLAFSLAIVGAARASAERRAGRLAVATFYSSLALLAALLCAGAVALGLAVMLDKG